MSEVAEIELRKILEKKRVGGALKGWIDDAMEDVLLWHKKYSQPAVRVPSREEIYCAIREAFLNTNTIASGISSATERIQALIQPKPEPSWCDHIINVGIDAIPVWQFIDRTSRPLNQDMFCPICGKPRPRGRDEQLSEPEGRH